jgi:hypothetical protein
MRRKTKAAVLTGVRTGLLQIWDTTLQLVRETFWRQFHRNAPFTSLL